MSEPPLHRPAAAVAAAAGVGFGIPGVFGLRHFTQTGEVWMFAGFPTYGDGPFEQVGIPTGAPLLLGFVCVCLAEVGLAAALWRGIPRSPLASHALLPIELVYWWGFALPFGFVFGLARTALVMARPRRSAGLRPARKR